MVCAKCQRLSKATELATPAVQRKSEIYYGSNGRSEKSTRTTTTSSGDSNKSSSSSRPNGVTKSKLLSKTAKNPYAAYSSSCATCKTRTEQGWKLCHRCAYKADNACARCGKSQVLVGKEKGSVPIPIVQGQRFSAK